MKTEGPQDGRWYAYCVQFGSVPATLRRRVSRQTAAHYRRIAALPKKIGLALDEAPAPFYIHRWIAWGKASGEVDSRFQQALRFRELVGGWPAWEALTEERPLAQIIAEVEVFLAEHRAGLAAAKRDP